MSEPYFKAAEVTEEIHKKPGFRWCKCGHLEGTHFADVAPVAQGGQVKMHVQAGPSRCHHTWCYCRQFSHDTSLWSRIKRKIKIK